MVGHSDRMKLKHVQIKNFKGIEQLNFSVEDTFNQPRLLTALLGGNGSGKTSLLQAIALTLSLATRRTRDIASFNWHGFLPERVASLGPTFVELEVIFEAGEITLTSELFEVWQDTLSSDRRQLMRIIPPSQYSSVLLQFDNGRLTSPQGFEAVNQFLGRYYIRALKDSHPEYRQNLAQMGDIFWFDQHRNLGSLMAGNSAVEMDRKNDQPIVGWQAGVEQLREYLIGWWGHHTTPQRKGRDLIAPLQSLFHKIFPGTRFIGLMPRGEITVPRANDFYFLIERDGLVYDLAEMSSGEQAVFPLLYEFVRLDIQRSITLIDELELHLHPPEQQRLLAALPTIGSNCQFFITTHSDFLASVIPDDQKVRMSRGTLCL